MTHPALTPDSVAVITGAASGIGRAAALRFAALGMTVVLVDAAREPLEAVAAEAGAAGAKDVMTAELDVTDFDRLDWLEKDVAARFGGTDILMNNAGIGQGTSVFGPSEDWRTVIDVNFWGVYNGTRAFGPRMIERGRPGAIVNTGSKQGITTPPGNPGYNVSKAAVKAFTEALAHELRGAEGARITAHLLIPGFVYTGMIARFVPEKPAAAWTPEETVEFFLERMGEGDFYILCPDNDVPRELDEKRMSWAMGDIIENRPALSRWHPDWTDAYEAFVKGG